VTEIRPQPPRRCNLAGLLLILVAPALARGAPSKAALAFEWTLDECVSKKLSAGQLEPLIALEGQTVQSSLPAGAGRHTQIHISCADPDGRRLVVTTQVTADVASRTLDLQGTSDELRPRVVALAATELLRRITHAPVAVPPPAPRREPAPTDRPRAALSPSLALPALAPAAAAATTPTAPARSWPRSARDVGFGLLGTSAVLTIVALGLSIDLVQGRGSGGFGDSGAQQARTELAIGLAASTGAVGMAAVGLYGYAATRSDGLTSPPPPATGATLRAGRAALALTVIGVAALVPATVTLGLAASNSQSLDSNASERNFYYSAAGLYATATLTLIAAAAMASVWWGRRQPPVRLSLRPSPSGASVSLSGRF
jgi:hypothetical protein